MIKHCRFCYLLFLTLYFIEQDFSYQHEVYRLLTSILRYQTNYFVQIAAVVDYAYLVNIVN